MTVIEMCDMRRNRVKTVFTRFHIQQTYAKITPMSQTHYKSRYSKLTGVNENELWHKARLVYGATVKSKRRKPYVRSKYFKNEKVFLDMFWSHTNSKKPHSVAQRLRCRADTAVAVSC
jgi:hypothetical protein